MRLVSMLPAATEIVYALGLGDQLVGVTFECDEPASARAEKTVVVGGLDTRGMPPGEIDAYVRGRLAGGGDLYTLHERALAGLRPDLIVTQDLCRVCALPSGPGPGRAGVPGLPGAGAHLGPAVAGSGAGLDPDGGPGHRGARPRRAPDRRAARPAGR